jgi:hypothetical protein
MRPARSRPPAPPAAVTIAGFAYRARLSLRTTLVAVAAMAVALASWKPLLTTYLVRGMSSAWLMVWRLGPGGQRQSDYVDAFESHRAALVDLGYFRADGPSGIDPRSSSESAHKFLRRV